MERKIGEIFEYNGEWLQCVEQPKKYDKTVCPICAFQGNGNCELDRCSGTYRSDKKSVIFKKLEKVGEPYITFVDKTVQNYLLETAVSVPPKDVFTLINNEQRLIAIEIKQNKEEDMEEKKTNFVEEIEALCKRYNMSDGVRADFISEIKEIIKDKDKKHSLKPFDLEAAKQGKPVCTRDGRKARIICFDAKGDYPIVALTETGNGEKVRQYMIDGHCTDIISQCCDDLMMLPEKKEGVGECVSRL